MNTQGIGLGLMISEQIVQQFKGDVTFHSELDVGSTFTFKFKLEGDEVLLTQEQNLKDTKF